MLIPCRECRHLLGVGFEPPGAGDLELIEHAKVAHLAFGRGKTLDLAEMGLATLYSGWALERRLDPTGQMRASRILLPGSVINLAPSGAPPGAGELVAATDVTFCQFDADRLGSSRQASLAMRLLRVALHQLGEAEQMLAVLRGLPATGRVAWLVRWIYAELVRRRLAHGESFLLPVTRRDLADLLDLTPVHFRRSAAVLNQKGVARIERQRVTILDAQRLDHAAGGRSSPEEAASLRTLL